MDKNVFLLAFFNFLSLLSLSLSFRSEAFFHFLFLTLLNCQNQQELGMEIIRECIENTYVIYAYYIWFSGAGEFLRLGRVYLFKWSNSFGYYGFPYSAVFSSLFVSHVAWCGWWVSGSLTIQFPYGHIKYPSRISTFIGSYLLHSHISLNSIASNWWCWSFGIWCRIFISDLFSKAIFREFMGMIGDVGSQFSGNGGGAIREEREGEKEKRKRQVKIHFYPYF